MQEMVRDYPMEFLGEDLTLWKEFLALEGFVPDLVFLNKNSDYIIAELQIGAIDREHLYRSIEYRDLLKNKENISNVEIILVANSIKEHHKKLLKVHNIKPIIISS